VHDEGRVSFEALHGVLPPFARVECDRVDDPVGHDGRVERDSLRHQCHMSSPLAQ
jgi:hypothetical protein